MTATQDPIGVLNGSAASETATARALRGEPQTLVILPADADGQKALAKRRHDIQAALRTLGFTVKALETGYRFDDDKAKAKVDAIAKAVAVLEREGELLLKVLTIA